MEDIRELHALGVHAALGMAIYTGRLDIARLARFEETTKAKPSGSPEGSAANL
jgi:hypothetical protein